jgi:hypothetical protein
MDDPSRYLAALSLARPDEFVIPARGQIRNAVTRLICARTRWPACIKADKTPGLAASNVRRYSPAS